MRIAILGNPDGWHTRELCAAGVDLGHEMVAVPMERLVAHLGSDRHDLCAGVVDLFGVERIVVRCIPAGSLEQVVFRMDTLHRLRAAGIRILNPPAAIEASVDKYLASARLASAGLPIPPTAAADSLDAALDAFDALGGDVVLKPLFGSSGRGIARLEDSTSAERAIRSAIEAGAIVYLQQFVAHPGYDVRALVLGGRLLAAMRRSSSTDFRTNVALGGRIEPLVASPECEHLAVQAAEAVGAALAGVDLVCDRAGRWMVLEVNSAPGFQALARTTDIPLAREIIAFCTSGVF